MLYVWSRNKFKVRRICFEGQLDLEFRRTYMWKKLYRVPK
jgi:hypothetical protein